MKNYGDRSRRVLSAKAEGLGRITRMSTVESLSVLSLRLIKTVRLLNRSCSILNGALFFNLGTVEKDLSPAALVAGFTRISLHHVITSFFIPVLGRVAL